MTDHLFAAPSMAGAGGAPVAALWSYLSSWLSADGGVNGPVVHRFNLKRMLATHDTPWTQAAVIGGLLHLYRRSGRAEWLAHAVRLADAQCRRLRPDGRYRWAGHEDDRFSSLVHNALADCALLDVAAAIEPYGDRARRARYLFAVERNLEQYVIRRLYRRALGGFVMNPFDYYAGQDRFIVNMNSVAVEALVKLDRQRETTHHLPLARAIGDEILAMQAHSGPCQGSFPYSNLEPDVHVLIYTALAVRGIAALAQLDAGGGWKEAAQRVAAFLLAAQEPGTGLWPHRSSAGEIKRFPLFVAGAGMIGNGILDAVAVTGAEAAVTALIGALLAHQYANGAIRNFIGYDHPDNAIRTGRGMTSWEDVLPTPNWNAQAFQFLCRVLPPPDPHDVVLERSVRYTTRRVFYHESARYAIIAGHTPPGNAIAGIYVKRWPFGLVVRDFQAVTRSLRRAVMANTAGRMAVRWLRNAAVRAHMRATPRR